MGSLTELVPRDAPSPTHGLFLPQWPNPKPSRMTEQKCLVQQCCCGCTLRTGSMIIAVLNLIANIFNIANGAYSAVGPDHYQGGWVGVIVAILHLIVSILLIIGINKEKRNFIMIWVWVSIVVIVITLIVGVISIFSGGLSVLIASIIAVLLWGYCVVVVRSYAISLGGGIGSPA